MNRLLEWNDYVDSLMNRPMIIDSTRLEINESDGSLPSIIKATLSLLEEIQIKSV